MIERLKTIKNVGTFKDASCGKCQLKKLTFIFGENSQGKSTLTDIIKSFKRNDKTIVENRKTVGETSDIEILLATPSKGIMEYKDRVWKNQKTKIASGDIQIFDTQFVNDNVFTNSKIEHENRENFTEFILGEKSITLNNELLEIEKTLKTCNDLKKALEALLADKCEGLDIEVLIKTNYEADVNKNDVALLGINSNIDAAEKGKKNLEKVKALPLPESYESTFPNLIQRLEENENIFKSEYRFDKEDVVANFEKHKIDCFKKASEADTWIAKGIENRKSDACPFCGNDTNGNELVASYLTIFCDELKKYNFSIDKLLKDDFKIDFSPLRLKISDNNIKTNELRVQNSDARFIDYGSKLDAVLGELQVAIDDLDAEVLRIKDAFEKAQEQKRLDRYKSYDYSFSELKTKIKSTDAILERYNASVKEFNNFAKPYLQELSMETLNKQIEDLKKEKLKNEYIYERNRWNKEITEHLGLDKIIKEKTAEKKTKKDEFDKQNNEFLQQFFNSGNVFFEKLNSKNFKINKEEVPNKGKKKVYSVSLSYRNNRVENDKLTSVLSESDKRALALSIFLSVIEINNNKDAILVFDDPIVSFDIDRMHEFTNIVKEFHTKCKQIIILTHYANFYKILVDLTKEQGKERSLLKIVRNCVTDSNEIGMVDEKSEPILLDQYQNVLKKALDFINGKVANYTGNEARILMQKKLEYKFIKEIEEGKISSTEKMGDHLKDLKDNGYIDNDLFVKLNNRRTELNNASHTFDSYTIDAKKRCVSGLWDELHLV